MTKKKRVLYIAQIMHALEGKERRSPYDILNCAIGFWLVRIQIQKILYLQAFMHYSVRNLDGQELS